jgi:hypothetical protein
MSYGGYGYFIWLIILWIIPIPIAISQGRSKDRAGLAYGLFLGWIGVIILASSRHERETSSLSVRSARNQFGVTPSCARIVNAKSVRSATNLTRTARPFLPLPNPALRLRGHSGTLAQGCTAASCVGLARFPNSPSSL